MTYTRHRKRRHADSAPSHHSNGHSSPRPQRHVRAPKKGFDYALLVKKAELQQETVVYKPQHNFADFHICDKLKSNIRNKGYVSPTPIQDQAIPQLLQNKDVVGIANTGTGKTAAFLIPLINKVFLNRSQRVLIIAPTRELAVQIKDECDGFTGGMNITSLIAIGGVGMHPQIQGLRRNPNFLIGTPGRLKDLHKQGHLNFNFYNNIVLDEVDRMLDMGFIADIKFIIGQLPERRQSLFFSATLSPEIQGIMQSFLYNPITISVTTGTTSKNVDQDIVKLDGRAKIDVLHDLLIQDGFEKVLVFGRTKWGIEKLTKNLRERGFTAASIHGNKNQNQRQRALDEFKQNKIQILLATDVASRGLDISDVTHVINYDLPESYDDYVHRIGRTGRADKKGFALSFIE